MWKWTGRLQIRNRKPSEEEKQRAKKSGYWREDKVGCLYLENQKSRMHYDAYRRRGLPITSSHIESTVKQINRR